MFLTSFLEAAALCKGVSHTWSLAFTLAPEGTKVSITLSSHTVDWAEMY